MQPAPPTSIPLQFIVAPVVISLLASAAFLFEKPLLFAAAIIGLLGFIPILSNPRVGFYLTVAAIPLDEVGTIGHILPMINISIAKIMALVTLVSWLLNLAMRKFNVAWRWPVGVFVLYWLWGAFTLLDAREVERGLQELVIQGTTILFIFMTFNLLRTKRQLMIALIIFSAASACSFAYAGIQRFLPGTEIAERVGWLEEGEATSGVEVSNIESGSIGTVRRSTGTSAHSNILGASSALLVPILLALMHLAKRRLWRSLALVGIVCCLAAEVVSLSRTGMLTYLVILPMLLISGLLVITPLRAALASLAALLALPFLPQGVTRIFDLGNYLPGNSVSVSERLKLWNAAVRAFTENPVTGFGFGNNRGIFDFYENAWNPGLLTVHSTYLQVLIETGLVGLLILLFFFYTILRMQWQACRLYKIQGDREGWTLTVAILISFTAFLLVGSIAFDFMRIGFKNMWFLVGCSIALYNIAMRRASRNSAL